MPENMTPGSSPTPESGQNPITTQATDFLSGTETANKDALYSELFQKNSDGEMVRSGQKVWSKLEIVTTVMGFIAIIAVLTSLAGAAHAFIKSRSDASFVANYPILCGYINSQIDAKEEKGCKTPAELEAIYKEKTKELQSQIVNQLSIYIPVKISSNAALNSPENTFITEKFNNKVNINAVISQFDKIRMSSQSPAVSTGNIECDSVNITGGNLLSVQCEVFGGDIGDTDTDGQLGSSRIEATRFLRRLAATTESQFIMETPPTSLSVEDVSTKENISAEFKTLTPISLSLRYTPFTPES